MTVRCRAHIDPSSRAERLANVDVQGGVQVHVHVDVNVNVNV